MADDAASRACTAPEPMEAASTHPVSIVVRRRSSGPRQLSDTGDEPYHRLGSAGAGSAGDGHWQYVSSRFCAHRWRKPHPRAPAHAHTSPQPMHATARDRTKSHRRCLRAVMASACGGTTGVCGLVHWRAHARVPACVSTRVFASGTGVCVRPVRIAVQLDTSSDRAQRPRRC